MRLKINLHSGRILTFQPVIYIDGLLFMRILHKQQKNIAVLEVAPDTDKGI